MASLVAPVLTRRCLPVGRTAPIMQRSHCMIGFSALRTRRGRASRARASCSDSRRRSSARFTRCSSATRCLASSSAACCAACSSSSRRARSRCSRARAASRAATSAYCRCLRRCSSAARAACTTRRSESSIAGACCLTSICKYVRQDCNSPSRLPGTLWLRGMPKRCQARPT